MYAFRVYFIDTFADGSVLTHELAGFHYEPDALAFAKVASAERGGQEIRVSSDGSFRRVTAR